MALVLLSVGRIVHRSVVFMLVAVFNDKWTDAVSEAFPRIPLFYCTLSWDILIIF